MSEEKSTESLIKDSHFIFLYGGKQYSIPVYMRYGIVRYVKDGLQPGSFLTAVICNNLKKAVWNADDENLPNIPAYVNYFYNHADRLCWGSEKKMKDWIEKKRRMRNE